MVSLKGLFSRLGSEALAHSFLSIPQMFHLARASTHNEREKRIAENATRIVLGFKPVELPKKVYQVICLSRLGSVMKITVKDDLTLGQIFHETKADQLVVFKDAI